MLYLPPGWGHDGVAVGECMTASIGFRAARGGELAAQLLARLADGIEAQAGALYGDAGQPATPSPGRIPQALQNFAQQAVERALQEPNAIALALGEWLTEPKDQVWFDAAPADISAASVTLLRLDRRSRMLHDARHVYINGEGHRVSGRDAHELAQLADTGVLSNAQFRRLSIGARAAVQSWLEAGWLHVE